MQRTGVTVTAGAATGAGLAEGILAWLSQAPAWMVLLLALAAAGVLVWIALAIDMMLRRHRTPDKAQVAELLRLQRSQHFFNHAVWNRLGHDADTLSILALDRDLPPIERDLAIAAEAIERHDGAATHLPDWHETLDRWYATVATVVPMVRSLQAPPDDAELRAARVRLPFARNLSSADLKAVLHYFVTTDRLAQARALLHARRDAILQPPVAILDPPSPGSGAD